MPSCGLQDQQEDPAAILHLAIAGAVCGPYGEADAVNTLLLYETLSPIIDREGTRAAYRLECDLMPLTIAMRRRGIRIDQDAAEQARDLLARQTRCRARQSFRSSTAR